MRAGQRFEKYRIFITASMALVHAAE